MGKYILYQVQNNERLYPYIVTEHNNMVTVTYTKDKTNAKKYNESDIPWFFANYNREKVTVKKWVVTATFTGGNCTELGYLGHYFTYFTAWSSSDRGEVEKFDTQKEAAEYLALWVTKVANPARWTNFNFKEIEING